MSQRERELKRLAEQIADDLFTNGIGEKAQRLVLTVDKPKHLDLGGWGKAAMANHIFHILEAEL